METIKQRRKKRANSVYSRGNVEINARLLPELPDFVENCFKILENFTLMLLNTNDQNNSEVKLNYCYCYFNTVRWQLGNSSSKNNILIEIAKSIIFRLQKSLGLLCSPSTNPNNSNIFNKSRYVVKSILPKYNISKKKNRRKFKSYMKIDNSIEPDYSTEFLNKLYWTLFHTNSQNTNNNKSVNMQNIIDQMYIQIQATLSENCIDDEEIWNLLSVSWKSEGGVSNSEIDIPQLSARTRHLSKGENQNYPWSGDCRTIEDCQEIFADQFDKFLCLDNLDTDVASLTRKIYASKNTLFTLKNRFRSDSELDEGFSESEFVYDIDGKSVDNEVESCELLSCEEFSYCSDYHYNSSNSKDHHQEILTTVLPTDHISNEDEDSDGGTELLNIVNDSLNQFNYLMHNPTMNVTDSDLPRKVIESHSSVPNNDFSSSTVTPPTGPLSPTVVYNSKDESPCVSSLNNNVQPFSLSRYDVISKLFVSPVTIQNWYSYNSSQPCAAANNSSPIVAVNNYCPSSTKIGSNWLPVISHSLISTGQYLIGNNHQHQQQQHQHNHHQQQPFHRIMLSPHLPLTSGNIGSQMQHGIVHLPQQLFHQLVESHPISDTECYDHRQLTINPQNNNQHQYSNPNNNNSSSEYSMLPLPGVMANSNCSNFVIPGASQAVGATVSHIKSCLDKSQRACCFYMRGGCKKEDCEYAHDLSKVTCKFWEKGDCFKSDTCPFKHGYVKT